MLFGPEGRVVGQIEESKRMDGKLFVTCKPRGSGCGEPGRFLFRYCFSVFQWEGMNTKQYCSIYVIMFVLFLYVFVAEKYLTLLLVF